MVRYLFNPAGDPLYKWRRVMGQYLFRRSPSPLKLFRRVPWNRRGNIDSSSASIVFRQDRETALNSHIYSVSVSFYICKRPRGDRDSKLSANFFRSTEFSGILFQFAKFCNFHVPYF